MREDVPLDMSMSMALSAQHVMKPPTGGDGPNGGGGASYDDDLLNTTGPLDGQERRFFQKQAVKTVNTRASLRGVGNSGKVIDWRDDHVSMQLQPVRVDVKKPEEQYETLRRRSRMEGTDESEVDAADSGADERASTDGDAGRGKKQQAEEDGSGKVSARDGSTGRGMRRHVAGSKTAEHGSAARDVVVGHGGGAASSIDLSLYLGTTGTGIKEGEMRSALMLLQQQRAVADNQRCVYDESDAVTTLHVDMSDVSYLSNSLLLTRDTGSRAVTALEQSLATMQRQGSAGTARSSRAQPGTEKGDHDGAARDGASSRRGHAKGVVDGGAASGAGAGADERVTADDLRAVLVQGLVPTLKDASDAFTDADMGLRDTNVHADCVQRAKNAREGRTLMSVVRKGEDMHRKLLVELGRAPASPVQEQKSDPPSGSSTPSSEKKGDSTTSTGANDNSDAPVSIAPTAERTRAAVEDAIKTSLNELAALQRKSWIDTQKGAEEGTSGQRLGRGSGGKRHRQNDAAASGDGEAGGGRAGAVDESLSASTSGLGILGRSGTGDGGGRSAVGDKHIDCAVAPESVMSSYIQALVQHVQEGNVVTFADAIFMKKALCELWLRYRSSVEMEEIRQESYIRREDQYRDELKARGDRIADLEFDLTDHIRGKKFAPVAKKLGMIRRDHRALMNMVDSFVISQTSFRKLKEEGELQELRKCMDEAKAMLNLQKTSESKAATTVPALRKELSESQARVRYLEGLLTTLSNADNAQKEELDKVVAERDQLALSVEVVTEKALRRQRECNALAVRVDELESALERARLAMEDKGEDSIPYVAQMLVRANKSRPGSALPALGQPQGVLEGRVARPQSCGVVRGSAVQSGACRVARELRAKSAQATQRLAQQVGLRRSNSIVKRKDSSSSAVDANMTGRIRSGSVSVSGGRALGTTEAVPRGGRAKSATPLAREGDVYNNVVDWYQSGDSQMTRATSGGSGHLQPFPQRSTSQLWPENSRPLSRQDSDKEEEAQLSEEHDSTWLENMISEYVGVAGTEDDGGRSSGQQLARTLQAQLVRFQRRLPIKFVEILGKLRKEVVGLRELLNEQQQQTRALQKTFSTFVAARMAAVMHVRSAMKYMREHKYSLGELLGSMSQPRHAVRPPGGSASRRDLRGMRAPLPRPVSPVSTGSVVLAQSSLVDTLAMAGTPSDETGEASESTSVLGISYGDFDISRSNAPANSSSMVQLSDLASPLNDINRSAQRLSPLRRDTTSPSTREAGEGLLDNDLDEAGATSGSGVSGRVSPSVRKRVVTTPDADRAHSGSSHGGSRDVSSNDSRSSANQPVDVVDNPFSVQRLNRALVAYQEDMESSLVVPGGTSPVPRQLMYRVIESMAKRGFADKGNGSDADASGVPCASSLQDLGLAGDDKDGHDESAFKSVAEEVAGMSPAEQQLLLFHMCRRPAALQVMLKMLVAEDVTPTTSIEGLVEMVAGAPYRQELWEKAFESGRDFERRMREYKDATKKTGASNDSASKSKVSFKEGSRVESMSRPSSRISIGRDSQNDYGDDDDSVFDSDDSDADKMVTDVERARHDTGALVSAVQPRSVSSSAAHRPTSAAVTGRGQSILSAGSGSYHRPGRAVGDAAVPPPGTAAWVKKALTGQDKTLVEKAQAEKVASTRRAAEQGMGGRDGATSQAQEVVDDNALTGQALAVKQLLAGHAKNDLRPADSFQAGVLYGKGGTLHAIGGGGRQHVDHSSLGEALSATMVKAVEKPQVVRNPIHADPDKVVAIVRNARTCDATYQVDHQAGQLHASPVQVFEFETKKDDGRVAKKPIQRVYSELREKIESMNIFVLQSNMPITEARGFSLTDQFPRIIVVNSADDVKPRTFTLLHEYAHVLLKKDGICLTNSENFDSNSNKTQQIEKWCNAFAGSLLMPKKEFLRELRTNEEKFEDIRKVIENLSKKFRASKKATIVRILNLSANKSDKKMYLEYYDKIIWEYPSKPKKKGGAAISQADKCISQKGKKYVRLVFDSKNKQLITTNSMISYLDLKVKHFDKLQSKI